MEPNIRRCVACRKTADKRFFLRVVRVHPSHAVQIGEGMGRSAYLCVQETCIQQAQKKKRLGKALKAEVPEVIFLSLLNSLQTAGAAQNGPQDG
jgi:uncharacterized protein